MITFTISPEGVAHIQLDDGKANALTQSCIDEALQCIDRAENEAKVSAFREGLDVFAQDLTLRS